MNRKRIIISLIVFVILIFLINFFLDMNAMSEGVIEEIDKSKEIDVPKTIPIDSLK